MARAINPASLAWRTRGFKFPAMNAPVRSAASVLLREDADHVAILTLNRPQARNSLSEALIVALTDTLAAIASDKSVRVVVIAANGPAFSAGHDMKEMTARRSDPDRGRAYFKQLMDACAAMMQAVVHLPKPVIACVQGPASAAGCQLVASCDLAVASQAAALATPGVNIGLFCSTPMVALSRNVPRKHAMQSPGRSLRRADSRPRWQHLAPPRSRALADAQSPASWPSMNP